MSLAWLLKNMLAAFLLPPLNGLSLLILAWIIRRRRRLALTLAWSGGLLLALLSLKPFALVLIASLEAQVGIVAAPKTTGAQAIVVLGGGRYRDAPEYGRDTVSEPTLVRLRYAAKLARETGLPLLVSGGSPEGGGASEADAMAAVLATEFGVPVRWREATSADTLDNARNSAAILAGAGVSRVLLVSHAWHLPRARAAFEGAGLVVIAAPTGFLAGTPLTPRDWLPGSLEISRTALHEWIGILWYRWRAS